ncbi:MAG: glycosyltransferase family 4 protein [Devosia sp.]
MSIDVMMIGLRSHGGGQGGVEKHVACLAEEYDRLGLGTCIVVRSPYAAEARTQVGISTWTKSLWSPRHVALEAPVHSVLATIYAAVVRPKVLHIHAVGPSLVAPLARLFGLKVVCTHHGQDYDREKWGRMAKFALRAGERCQAMFAHGRICVSKSLSVALTGRYGRVFEYIPNAVRMPPTPDTFETLANFGLTPGKYIVNVGRLVPEKRQIDLVKAFAQIGRTDLSLVLVGAADHASSYAAELTTLAAATPGVVMTGFQRGQCLAELIGGAAVFALPSTHEGMPIAALEAMSMQRPLVISDIPPNLDLGLPATCYHEVTSVESLAERLRETLDRHAGEAIPMQDWSSYLEPYDWSIVAGQTLALYQTSSPAFARRAQASVPSIAPQ